MALRFCEENLSETELQHISERNLDRLEMPDDIFPWKNLLSNGIQEKAFEASFLKQPDLFLRIRPGQKETVIRKLNAANVPYSIEQGNAIRLPNTTKIQDILLLNKEVVVQDLSSQQVANLLRLVAEDTKGERLQVYDCCAASGGKSILATDNLPHFELTVSDIRPTIIANLKKRFSEAGILQYHSFVHDAAQTLPTKKTYNLLIADVPCSGSGTWSRTPEQLFYFDSKNIAKFEALQKSILQSIAPLIKPGGYLLYITCSVFRQENEQQIDLVSSWGFDVVQQNLIKGYEQQADTMFAALLKNF
ncbi:MAG: Fmu (Sun) domain protein [Niabella sp.]